MACECGMIENAYKTYIELSDSAVGSLCWRGGCGYPGVTPVSLAVSLGTLSRDGDRDSGHSEETRCNGAGDREWIVKRKYFALYN